MSTKFNPEGLTIKTYGSNEELVTDLLSIPTARPDFDRSGSMPEKTRAVLDRYIERLKLSVVRLGDRTLSDHAFKNERQLAYYASVLGDEALKLSIDHHLERSVELTSLGQSSKAATHFKLADALEQRESYTERLFTID